MSYTSLVFAAFVLILCVLYYLLSKTKFQWVVLLAGSIFFYLYASVKYAVFIVFTSLTVYAGALLLDKLTQKRKQTIKANKGVWSKEEKSAYKKKMERKAKAVVAADLVLNFGILIVLKYYNFVAGGISSLLPGDTTLPVLSLVLPLGISFYTFQATGYLIDVYRETIKPERNILKFGLFVSFFPQIVQGPISDFTQLENQLISGHKLEFRNIKTGLERILWGLFKKLVIADRLVNSISAVTGAYENYDGIVILYASLLYAVQLYCDFSGGIDISIGVSQLFGINLTENFRRPYFSKTIGEYWRRWHITLGEWMKKYIFYSLAMSDLSQNMTRGINKKFGTSKAGAHIAKSLPSALASFVVFMVVGIWHGANGKYIAFGVWNGLLIMLSTLLKPVFVASKEKLHIKDSNPVWCFWQMLRTFILVLIGYFFDIANDFGSAMRMMRKVLAESHWSALEAQVPALGLTRFDAYVLIASLLVLFVSSILFEKQKTDSPGMWLEKKPYFVQWLILYLLIVAVALFGIYGPDYSAAEFVYMQF